MKVENKTIKLLCRWGICDKKAIKVFSPRLRDREDISVMKCHKSGVVFLSTSKHMEISHYSEKTAFSLYYKTKTRKEALLSYYEDDSRRQNQFQDLISRSNWLDVGTGAGGILDLLAPFAKRAAAVEPREKMAKLLRKEGYEIYSDITKVPFNDFGVVTFFHTLEHMTEPLEVLKDAYQKMAKDAKIVVEIPHANDFLFSFLNDENFKSFTFWSEHLVLHTRQSLTAFLERAGFKNIVIKGFQRYPLANHLHWLREGKPHGQILWSALRTNELDTAYSNLLKEINMTDTLIAIAKK